MLLPKILLSNPIIQTTTCLLAFAIAQNFIENQTLLKDRDWFGR